MYKYSHKYLSEEIIQQVEDVGYVTGFNDDHLVKYLCLNIIGSKAKVLNITCLDGTDSDLAEIASDYDKKFIYRVGEIVEVLDFDDNRWNECAAGIHFFITREEAVKYC